MTPLNILLTNGTLVAVDVPFDSFYDAKDTLEQTGSLSGENPDDREPVAVYLSSVSLICKRAPLRSIARVTSPILMPVKGGPMQ